MEAIPERAATIASGRSADHGGRPRAWYRGLRIGACLCAFSGGTVGALVAQVGSPGMEKSPVTAVRLSFATTTLPIAVGFMGRNDLEAGALVLVVGGLVVGPVSGYIYGGETERGMAQVGRRAIAVAATVGAVALVCTAGCEFRIFGDGGDDGALLPAVLVGAAGTALVAVLARRDIGRVGDVVRENNRAIAVRPQYVPGSRSGGLAVTWRF